MPIPKTIPGLRRRLVFIFGGHELELPCEAVDHEVLAGAVEATVQEGGYHQEESENQCCPSAHLWLLLSVPGTQPSTYDSASGGVNEGAAALVAGGVPHRLYRPRQVLGSLGMGMQEFKKGLREPPEIEASPENRTPPAKATGED